MELIIIVALVGAGVAAFSAELVLGGHRGAGARARRSRRAGR